MFWLLLFPIVALILVLLCWVFDRPAEPLKVGDSVRLGGRGTPWVIEEIRGSDADVCCPITLLRKTFPIKSLKRA